MKQRILKIRTLIAVAVAGVLLFSCSKEKDKAELVGTWTYDSATISTMVGTKTFSQYLIDELGLNAAQAQAYETIFNEGVKQYFTGTFQMKSDNTYTTNFGDETDTGTWSVNSDQTALTIDSDTDVPYILSIVELTSSKLHVQEVETGMDDLNQDGTMETLTITVDIIYKR
jgi:hypothetical protein